MNADTDIEMILSAQGVCLLATHAEGALNHNLDGFPSGRLGLFSTVAGVTFDHLRVLDPQNRVVGLTLFEDDSGLRHLRACAACAAKIGFRPFFPPATKTPTACSATGSPKAAI